MMLAKFTQADLPVLPFPPANMPSGSPYENATKSSQEVCDIQYLGQVNGYIQRGASYVITEVLKRAQSGLKGNYAATPFPSPSPQRTIVGWTVNDGTGMAEMSNSLAPVDLRIQAPKLPDWVDSAPATGSGGPLSGGGVYTPMQDAVQVLGPKLDKILAALGLQ